MSHTERDDKRDLTSRHSHSPLAPCSARSSSLALASDLPTPREVLEDMFSPVGGVLGMVLVGTVSGGFELSWEDVSSRQGWAIQQ